MQVKTPEQKRPSLREAGDRYSEKRRGNRMNSRVRIRAEWDANKNRLSGEAFTRVINPYGCMVILKDTLDLNQRLSLTNVATGTSNAAVVVWKGNPRPEGWEYGIELIAPDMDFWGMEL
jgi:hypothetical protein